MLGLMGRILSCFLRCLCGNKDHDDEERATKTGPNLIQQPRRNPLPPRTTTGNVHLRAPLLTSIRNGDAKLRQPGLLVALEACQDEKPFVLLPRRLESSPPNPCTNVDPPIEAAPLLLQESLGDSLVGSAKDSKPISRAESDQLTHSEVEGRSFDQALVVDISAKEQAKIKSLQSMPRAEGRRKEGAVVKLYKVAAMNETWKKHYSSRHKILLVGEGDFSFSASLAMAFGSGINIVATSLDSQEFLSRNYMKAMANISGLKAKGCLVMHELDATKMAKHGSLQGLKFDRIVFNFPHAGFFPKESSGSQIQRHQKLIRTFFKNAKKLMKEGGGEVHITHKTNWFHRQWDLEGLASGVGLRLVAREKFNFIEYPGYNTKYGFGGDKNFNCNPSSTYKFGVQKTAT